MTSAQATEEFWTQYQPGFRFSDSPVGSAEFFAEVERHRYHLEPHIPEIVQFERWRDADVLEVGCGIATDGIRFARAGAHYSAIDRSPTALRLARRRMEAEGLTARLEQASATGLPFDDESFDLVYSHGVLHHLPDPDLAISELFRVLRPGGRCLAMVYHRGSLNYHLNIMVVRRFMAPFLLLPGMPSVLARALGQDEDVLLDHRQLLRRHGLRYLRDRELFLSHNTDGPGNPLSRVYSRNQARALFRRFSDLRTAVRFLNLRIVPGGERLARSPLGRRTERRAGWHLYVLAAKPVPNPSQPSQRLLD